MKCKRIQDASGSETRVQGTGWKGMKEDKAVLFGDPVLITEQIELGIHFVGAVGA
jgi:hypothetical protein